MDPFTPERCACGNLATLRRIYWSARHPEPVPETVRYECRCGRMGESWPEESICGGDVQAGGAREGLC